MQRRLTVEGARTMVRPDVISPVQVAKQLEDRVRPCRIDFKIQCKLQNMPVEENECRSMRSRSGTCTLRLEF